MGFSPGFRNILELGIFPASRALDFFTSWFLKDTQDSKIFSGSHLESWLKTVESIILPGRLIPFLIFKFKKDSLRQCCHAQIWPRKVLFNWDLKIPFGVGYVCTFSGCVVALSDARLTHRRLEIFRISAKKAPRRLELTRKIPMMSNSWFDGKLQQKFLDLTSWVKYNTKFGRAVVKSTAWE